MNPTAMAALLFGSTAGLGLALLVAQLVPARTPKLSAALSRLSTQAPEVVDPAPGGADLQERVGRLLLTRAGHLPGLGIPSRELALLRIRPSTWMGQRALLGVIGLALPPIFTAILNLEGVSAPWSIPTLGSLLCAALLFTLPVFRVKERAAKAREDFARAVGAYIELVALERLAGSGTNQALESAAMVGDSWVFERIREELLRSRLSGTTPWDSLSSLSDELGIPELADLSDIMRLAGEEGAQVYEALRARGRSLRTAMLTREQAQANAASERMVMPVAVLALVFALTAGAPAAYTLLTS